MAGIEKVCELSGVGYGWKMYGYKRNSIQIHPQYRKLFRGVSYVLHIQEEKWASCNGSKEYKYCLQVFDPSLTGQVGGKYYNWSKDIPTVKRKLKRLLRCKRLNIKGFPC